jgi:hypothetical protein
LRFHRPVAALLALNAALACASPEERISAAMRDAQSWVDCTRAFDAACVAAATDPDYLFGMGTTPDLFARTQSLLYGRLKDLHAIVTRFQLYRPREVFRLDARDVVFIPYDQAFEMGTQHAESSAFLIGLSRNDGLSWRFIDGSTVTGADVRLTLPSYNGEPPLPPAYSSASNDGEAGPYRQIYAGFNGPKDPHTYNYYSAEEVRGSWLAQALGDRLDQVLSQVDFAQQILIAAAAGARTTANGDLSLSRIDVNDSVVTPYLQIGVNKPGCEQPMNNSYPFVLAARGRTRKNLPSGGMDFQNYLNGCTRTASGEPHG